MIKNFAIILILVFCEKISSKDEPKLNVPGYGTLTGKIIKTSGLLGRVPKTYYAYRNLTYAKSVSGDKRFSQSELFDGPLPNQNHDATQTGPICPQSKISEVISFLGLPISLLLKFVWPESSKELSAIVETIYGQGILSKSSEDVLKELFDINLSVSEDCLHLSVYTPHNPDQDLIPSSPVMVYIHGGGFNSGFQLMMGPERLGDVADIVLVTINYRLGLLGFLCLDDETAPGNMGIFDIITALKWIQKYIEYFGGNPDSVTIFGSSAGGASVGHLIMSNHTKGLIHRAIGQSGSALAPWSFDSEAIPHVRSMAKLMKCNQEQDSEIVKCLKSTPISDILRNQSFYSNLQRSQGYDGFRGQTVCMQTRGSKKFYSNGEKPIDILLRGNFSHVPIFFGANLNEGSYLLIESYEKFIKPHKLESDAEFINHKIINSILQVSGITQSFAFKEIIEEKFFHPNQLGNFKQMTTGLIDLFGVLFFKAGSYKTVEEFSPYTNAFWYSLEHKSRKSMIHLLELGVKIDFDSGVSHGEDHMYLFDMTIPLVLCDLNQTLNAAFKAIRAECGSTKNIACLKNPKGPLGKHGQFLKDHSECLFGYLTKEEEVLADKMVTAWTNFAIHGTPTPKSSVGSTKLPHLQPWSRAAPFYLRFDSKDVTVERDYRKTYHQRFDPPSTPPTTDQSRSTSGSSSLFVTYAIYFFTLTKVISGCKN